MVANQVPRKIRKQEALLKANEHLLKSLQLDSRKVPTNFADWVTGVENWSSAMDIAEYLKRDGNIQVPENELARVLAERKAEKSFASYVIKEKFHPTPPKMVKDPSTPSPRGKTKEKQKQETVTAVEEKQPQPRASFGAELLKRIAKRTAAASTASDLSTKASKTVYFVDADIACNEEEKAQLEAEGYCGFVKVKLSESLLKGSDWYCPVETSTKRENRLFIWRALLSTLAGLDATLWEHIPLGNLWMLLSFIKETYGKERGEEQSKKWHSRLKHLKVSKDKGFVHFQTEVTKLVTDAAILNIQYDLPAFREKIQKRIFQGEVEAIKEEWSNALRVEARAQYQNPEMKKWTVPQLLKEMGAVVRVSEEAGIKKGGSMSQLQRENEELKRKIQKFHGSERKGDRFPWMGACGKFQQDKCDHKECKFQHIKLDKEDSAKLMAHLKERGEARKATCAKCGRKGHKIDTCRVSTTKQIRKTLLMELLQDKELLQAAKREAGEGKEDSE